MVMGCPHFSLFIDVGLGFRRGLCMRTLKNRDHTQRMGDANYEIDIEPGHDDDEMQVDEDSPSLNRKGRGFRGNARVGPYGSRNGVSENPAAATAVRCIYSLSHVCSTCN